MKYKTTQVQISGDTPPHEGVVGGYGGIVGHFSLGKGNMDTTNFYTKQEIDLMIQNKTVMEIHTIYNLPNVGKTNTLYFVLSEKAVYIWIEATATYECMSGQQGDLDEINGGGA